MKALGPNAAHLIDRRGEHVLAGVLLHVLEPAGPVDVARDDLDGRVADPTHGDLDLALDQVDDRAVLPLDDVEHAGAAERAGVEGLAARRRVERGAIEHDARAASGVADAHQPGVEGLEIRVEVVETLGHGRMTGSGTPASLNPLARSRQLSQRPHGRPSGSGS